MGELSIVMFWKFENYSQIYQESKLTYNLWLRYKSFSAVIVVVNAPVVESFFEQS